MRLSGDVAGEPGFRTPWRVMAAFGALALLIALPFLLVGEQLETFLHRDRLVAAFQSYRSFAWLVAVALLVSDLVLPIPNTMVIAALGIIYGPLIGGLVATLGNCLSGLLGYGLCRRFGRPLAKKLLGEADLHAGEVFFARSGGLLVAASRWLPILPEAISCMAGLARMPLPVFLLALVCGAAPFGFIVAGLGYAGSDNPIAAIALCALLPLPLWFLVRAALPAGSARS